MASFLFSWVGHADLAGMATALNDEKITLQIQKIVPGNLQHNAQAPVESVLKARSFDRVILLWDFDQPDLRQRYLEYLANESVEIVPVSLSAPTDYGAIYEVVDRVIAKNLQGVFKRNITYLLSPGTPAMAAIWVLLGKTKYPGAFLQVYQNHVADSVIPFELTVDVIPELMRGPSRMLQQLPFEVPSMEAGFENIIGTSPAIRDAKRRAYKAALYDIPVLLTGESGCGKELFAHAIWQAGTRKNARFEAINCAALPANLLEAELFGYCKGAFTGAGKDKAGAFERLNGGTLFLDEVGECSAELQAKLLRVLQPPPDQAMTCREFFPIGANKPMRSDVRIIAATNRDLRSMISHEAFRSDLFFRLAALEVHLPPLRERREDILPLAEALLARANADFQKQNVHYEYKYFCNDTKIFM